MQWFYLPKNVQPWEEKKKDLRKIQDKDLLNKTKKNRNKQKIHSGQESVKKKKKSFHTLHSAKQQDSAFAILTSDP